MRGRTIAVVGGVVSGLVAAAAPGAPVLVAIVVSALLWVGIRIGTSPGVDRPVIVVPPPPADALPRPLPPRQQTPPTGATPPPPARVAAHPVAAWSARSHVAVRRTPPLQRLRELIASDLAVHGLAYLGVLLVFAGTFGFILVSFSRLSPSLRPVGEVAVPAVLLGAAAFLRRRGAPVVATALGLLGGTLFPIVIAASLVDGIDFPPEVHGPALAITLAALMLGLAATYRAYVSREPEASLRYLVAPMIWAACWSVGLLAARHPGVAVDLHRWSSAQMAIVTVGVAATTVWSRRRPRSRLAGPTRVAAAPGLVIAYTLVIGIAAVEGWPAPAVAVGGVAAWIALEALSRDASDPICFAQLFVVATTCAALAPGIGAAASGAVATLVFTATLERSLRGRDPAAVSIGAAIGAGLALVVSVMEPQAMLVAFGVVAAWAHVRRVLRRGELEPWITAASWILPIPAAAALIDLTGTGPGLVAIGAAALMGAIASRVMRTDDPFYGSFVPAAGGVVVLGTVVAVAVAGSDAPALAAASGTAGLAIAVASRPPWIAVWAGTAAVSWSGWLGGQAAGLAAATVGLGWSSVGLGMVIAATILRTRGRMMDHVAGAGTTLALAGLVASRGDAGLAPLACWCAAWVVSAATYELGEAPVVRLLERVPGWLGRRAGLVPCLAAAASVPFLVVRVGEGTGVLEAHRSWHGVALAVLAIGYASSARVCVRPSTRGALAVAAFVLCLVGVSVAAPDAWPTIEAIASVIVVVVVLGGDLRRPAMTWIAWTASAVLVALLAGRIGISSRDLPVVVLAWGVLATVGGLALDDVVSGGRARGSGVRASWLVPPVALGAIAIPGALAFVAGRGDADLSAWALVGAAIYLAIAAELRAGSVSVASWALLTFAAAEMSPRDPITSTWVFVPWIAALVLAGRFFGPRRGATDAWLRWDLPVLVVAHGTAAVALARAASLEQMSLTWTAIGAVALAGAILWRRPVDAAMGCLLVTAGACAAGPGWFALALAATSVGSAIVASLTPQGSVRSALFGVSVVSGAGAGFELGVWRGWSPDHEARLAATASATLAIAAAGLVRWTRVGRDGATATTALAAVAGVASVAFAAELPPEPGARLAATCAALVIATASAGLALVARPLAAPILRPVSAGVVTVAGALAWYGLAAPPDLVAWLAAGIGVVATIVAVSLWRTHPNHAWSDGLLVLIGGAMGVGLIASIVVADHAAIEATLVLAGVVSAALGIGLRRRWLLAIASCPLTIAWLLLASDALADQPQAFTVPIGIAILVVVAVGRAASHEAGEPVAPELRILEFAGMVFLVSGGLVEAVVATPAHGVGALLAGVAIACWGTLTRVRRRVAFGACVAVLAAVEMPVVSVIPTLRTVTASGLWAGLVIAGVLILALATGMERGRTRIRAAIGRVGDLMEGWE